MGGKMIDYCPQCGGIVRVVETRRTRKKFKRRRRKCVDCGYLFTTYEFAHVDLEKFAEAVTNLESLAEHLNHDLKELRTHLTPPPVASKTNLFRK